MNHSPLPKVQVVHETSIDAPNEIVSYVHCGKCLDERPPDQTPEQWARTQTGYTKKGIQVWCTRHQVNVDTMVLQVSPSVVHACNLYPELVQALEEALIDAEAHVTSLEMRSAPAMYGRQHCNVARAVLERCKAEDKL